MMRVFGVGRLKVCPYDEGVLHRMSSKETDQLARS